MRAGRRDRLLAALASIGLQLLIALALILGLRVSFGGSPEPAPMLVTDIPVQPPPPRAPEPEREGDRAKDAPAPPNLRSRATDIVAPPPVIVTPPPPPVITAAPVAGEGVQSSQGAADFAGPGTGAGGWGNGTGGGGRGGLGGTPPRHLRGSLRDSDYPKGAAELGIGGTVGVRYRVGVDGRVRQCLVTRSSGSAELDATTCALIERRFRFRPARDEEGRPVSSTIVENHSWIAEREPPR